MFTSGGLLGANIGALHAFQTVDPKYGHFFKMAVLLVRLNVIGFEKTKIHGFGLTSLLTNPNPPDIKGWWIPMTIVSLQQQYMEIVFGKGSSKDASFHP